MVDPTYGWLEITCSSVACEMLLIFGDRVDLITVLGFDCWVTTLILLWPVRKPVNTQLGIRKILFNNIHKLKLSNFNVTVLFKN